jgi:hypothetical protein
MFELKKIDDYIKFGRLAALFSFLIGSVIIAVFYFTEYNGIIYISLLFIISAFMVNTYLACCLIYAFFKLKQHRKNIAITLFLMLLSIPVGLFYLDLGFTLYNQFLDL